MTNILEVEQLKKHFPIRRGILRKVVGQVRAVDGVSLTIRKGETLSLVGESGCGKTTVSRCIVRALHPTSGAVRFRLGDGPMIDIAGLDRRGLSPLRSHMQMIFQDPFSSLNPRMTVGDIIAEPLITHEPQLGRAEVRARVRDIMAKTGLLPQMINRYPHEFSGGQCQRIGVARAMILNPRLIVCDEPVSALDVSIQAQIINLLMELQRAFGLSLLFISHDLSVVRHISQRILVLYLGRMMELADSAELYRKPRHPYTRGLIACVPHLKEHLTDERAELTEIEGIVPPLSEFGQDACLFASRCPLATERCVSECPPLMAFGAQRSACWYAEAV